MIPNKSARSIIIPVLLTVGLLGLIIGCGGGGGGGGTGASSSTSSSSGQTIALQYDFGSIISNSTPALSPGDQISLGATVTVDGITTQLSPYNFVVPGGASEGTVTSQGLFTAGSGVVAGRNYTITATTNIGQLTWQFRGAAPLANPLIMGIVESTASRAGIAGATITAYDSSGTVAGTATSAADGTFSLSVSTAATHFSVAINGVAQVQGQTTYFAQFGYGAFQFPTASSSCLPTLPSFATGNHRYILPYAIQLDSDLVNGFIEPPPPPPGCFGP